MWLERARKERNALLRVLRQGVAHRMYGSLTDGSTGLFLGEFLSMCAMSTQRGDDGMLCGMDARRDASEPKIAGRVVADNGSDGKLCVLATISRWKYIASCR